MRSKNINFFLEKISILVLLAAALIVAGSINTQSAFAEGDEETGSIDSYTAIEGDNITALVRRSIANSQSDLSNEQALFVEANVVQEMNCGDVLHVGQQVDVDNQLISKYAQQAKELNEQQVAAWSVYANNVDFASATQERSETSSDSSSSDTPSGSAESSDDKNDDDNKKDKDDDDKDDDDGEILGVRPRWWILGAVVGGGAAWYVHRTKQD